MGAGAAVAIASWISAHACLAIAVEVPGQPREDVSVPVTARPSGSGWIARALVRPASWANAGSITVVSLSLDGLPLVCDYLPVTLQVGYNHAPSPAGVIVRAAKTGRVAALQAALDAGGSTAEADAVRYYVKGPRKGRTTQAGDSFVCETFPPFLPLTLLQYGDTASHWAATLGHLEALRTLLAAGADPAASTRVRRGEEKPSALRSRASEASGPLLAPSREAAQVRAVFSTCPPLHSCAFVCVPSSHSCLI